MSYMKAIKSGFSNYAKFNGRASRLADLSTTDTRSSMATLA